MNSKIRGWQLVFLTIVSFIYSASPSLAQSASQDVRTDSVVEGTSNNVIQIPNQNNNQNNAQSSNNIE